MLETEKAVRDYLEDCGSGPVTITQCEVVKLNDETVHGLTLTPEGKHAGWTLYFDDLYFRYEDGEPAESLMEEASYRCAEGMEFELPAEPENIDLSFESVRDRLTVRLVGVRQNMRYMKGRPYIDVGCGLALIAVINRERDTQSEWTLSVTDELLKNEIRCSREELLTAAMENTVRIEPPVLAYLSDCVRSGYIRQFRVRNYLDETEDRPEDIREALVLTNRSTMFGAAALFYPGVAEKIAEILGCGFYVLPSSLHEVIVVADAAEPDIPGMMHTVHEANATVLERCDLLSDNIFHFDPASGVFSIVRDAGTDCTGEKAASGRSIA